MKSKLLIAIAALVASSILSAEQGNYILGPIDDAPIEIAVPEVSEDGRPAGVPENAIRRLVRLDEVGGDSLHHYSASPRRYEPGLFGVDAPQTYPGSQPYAKEAVQALRYMLDTGIDARNKGAAYMIDMRFAQPRSLGVQLYHATEGYDINASLVCAGYAWWHRSTWQRKVLSDCEAEARREKRGLWSDPNPIAPWDWREGVRD